MWRQPGTEVFSGVGVVPPGAAQSSNIEHALILMGDWCVLITTINEATKRVKARAR